MNKVEVTSNTRIYDDGEGALMPRRLIFDGALHRATPCTILLADGRYWVVQGTKAYTLILGEKEDE